MPLYRYTYQTPSGERREGLVEADTLEAALRSLRERGVFPLDLAEAKQVRRSRPLGPARLAALFRQLNALLRTGKISVPEALRLLGDQIPKKLQERYQAAVALTLRGQRLSEALGATDLFPRLALALLQVGEGTGKLDAVLGMLYRYYSRQASFQRKLRSALTYPTAIVIIALLVTWGLMTFIVPQFGNLLREMDAPLPLVTQAVMSLSAFLSSPAGLALTAGGLLALYQGARVLLASEERRRRFERLLLRLPVLGPLVKYGNLATIASTMELTYTAGVHVYEGLDYVRRSATLLIYQDALEEVRKSILTGRRVSEAFQAFPELFTTVFTSLVKIGEEAGQLEEMLRHIYTTYEEEAESILGSISSVVEPFLLVFVGGLVGLIMLSVLLPYFSLIQQVGGF